MGNSTSNSTKITEQVNNNFLNTTSNVCQANDFNTISGVVGKIEILKGSKVGDVTGVSVSGTMNASCTIDQQISQSAASILASQAQQSATTENDLFNDGVLYSQNKNSADVFQSTVNNMVNVTSNNCNSTSSSTIQNSAISIQSQGKAGNITAFAIGNDSSSTCAISNMVGQESYSNMQAGVDQEAKTMGMFVAIFSAMVSMMIIGLIAIVVLFGGGALIMGISKSGKKEEGGGDEDLEYDDS